MATIELTSPVSTRTLSLGTTVSVIEIPAAVAGRIQALYLYAAAEVRYQIIDGLVALQDGDTAPTADYGIIPSATLVPVPVSFAERIGGQIAVWVASSTTTLHVAPYPLTRG